MAHRSRRTRTDEPGKVTEQAALDRAELQKVAYQAELDRADLRKVALVAQPSHRPGPSDGSHLSGGARKYSPATLRADQSISIIQGPEQRKPRKIYENIGFHCFSFVFLVFYDFFVRFSLDFSRVGFPTNTFQITFNPPKILPLKIFSVPDPVI